DTRVKVQILGVGVRVEVLVTLGPVGAHVLARVALLVVVVGLLEVVAVGIGERVGGDQVELGDPSPPPLGSRPQRVALGASGQAVDAGVLVVALGDDELVVGRVLVLGVEQPVGRIVGGPHLVL